MLTSRRLFLTALPSWALTASALTRSSSAIAQYASENQSDVAGTVWSAEGKTLKGINSWSPFGTARVGAKPYYEFGGPFKLLFPSSRLALIRQTGFDFIRLCVDIGPLAAANERDFGALLDKIMAGITAIVEAKLKVIINLSPTSFSGWELKDVLDGVNGTKFLRLLSIEKMIATKVNSLFQSTDVAISLFNELPFKTAFRPGVSGYQLMKTLHAAVRAVAPTTTLIVSATGYASLFDLTTDFDTSDFDSNTIYDFHAYLPMTASRQGEPGTIWRNISRLTFPPQKHVGGYDKARSDLQAAIAADNTWSPQQRIDVMAEMEGGFKIEGLKTYFGLGWGRFLTGRVQDAEWIESVFEIVTKWADRHGIRRNQIMLGEFGAYGDFGSTLANTPESQAAILHAMRSAAEKARFHWNVLELFYDPRSIGTGWGIMKADNFMPHIIAALGLSS